MAAASGEINPQPGQNEESGGAFTDDSKEGKKKKFRPFEAVRKFFKSGKKGVKSKEYVRESAVKSRSLQRITGLDDSDDDGGFKKRLGNRSMSEDSVFQPEVKEPKKEAMRHTAISMEGLNKDFQSELASKLKKRYSLHSSDDEALPQSPTPPITTADIVMGSSMKPLPATGKSQSKESDISIDASETEEDDPFKTDWGKSVASVSERKQSVQSLPDSADMDLDLAAIGKETVILSNDAARHRISVKRNIVKRRPSGARKNKDHRASATSPLPEVKEESPTKSEVIMSPVKPEPLSPVSTVTPVAPSPLSPKSPVTPVTPTPLSPKSSYNDLVFRLEDKIPEQKANDINKSATELPKKMDDPVLTDVSKKPDEHKTVIAIGHTNDKDTSQHVSFSAGTKTQEDKPPMKSMSLDRRMNFNLSDYEKSTDEVRQISRQRPKSLHDSSVQVQGSDTNTDSELSKSFNQLKRNSLKENDSATIVDTRKNTGSAVTVDTQKDTGFYLVGSLKSKDKDIPFGARRPETKAQVTSFNEGMSTKLTDTSSVNTQAKSDLVKPAVSPTKPSITGYVLKKEPLKVQSSLSGDKKDNSPTSPNVAMEIKSDKIDSQKETVKQTLSDGNKEFAKDVNYAKGAEDKSGKDPKYNYENVVLNVQSGTKNTNTESKDIVKSSDKVITISADSKKIEESSIKGRVGNYDNVVITTNESTNKLASPREEYRLKRQSRSRTLPEQPVSADLLSNKPTSRKDSLTQSFKLKDNSNQAETILESSETMPLESKSKILSSSLKASSSSEVGEPNWMKMAKKRQEDAKEKETDSVKDKNIGKPAFTGSRINSLPDSTKDKLTPKSVFTSGLTSEPSKEKLAAKVSEPSSLKTPNKSGNKGINSGSTEPQMDTKVTKPTFSAVGSLNNKDNKDTINTDKKSDAKTEEKSSVSAASLAKSFESSLKPLSTGRNVSLDSPKGWKSSSSMKPKEVKIEIIEKTDTAKTEETSKPVRTTTAKKMEEKAPLRDNAVPEKCLDRKSKVLDMVKNFQNLQVS